MGIAIAATCLSAKCHRSERRGLTVATCTWTRRNGGFRADPARHRHIHSQAICWRNPARQEVRPGNLQRRTQTRPPLLATARAGTLRPQRHSRPQPLPDHGTPRRQIARAGTLRPDRQPRRQTSDSSTGHIPDPASLIPEPGERAVRARMGSVSSRRQPVRPAAQGLRAEQFRPSREAAAASSTRPLLRRERAGTASPLRLRAVHCRLFMGVSHVLRLGPPASVHGVRCIHGMRLGRESLTAGISAV
jgi:hypothetical protein